jgi:iron complex outermembrane receptor protein
MRACSCHMSDFRRLPSPRIVSRPGTRLAGMAAWLVCLGSTALAQSTADLTSVSVEDLMRIEVTSVSKKERPLGTSPAAVFVLTHEDIRRSGLTSVPELLRLVPGLHVARIDGSKWAVTARGFNGRFANKLLVLVDGRTVYSPLFSGVYWDEVDVPLEDIERVEVIRGPGATMWGANAVNGVINVITRPADATQGASVSLTTGTEDRLAATARYGGTFGNGVSWRAWGKAFDRRPLARADGHGAADGWRMGRGGFRADYRPSEADAFTLQGDLHEGREDQTSAALLDRAPYRELHDERADVSGRNLVARWTRTHSPQSETSLQVFADHTSRLETLLDHRRTTLDVDFQHRQALGARHDLVWGLGYRRGRSELTNSALVYFADTDRPEWLVSVFAEDEVQLVPERLALTLGMKVERNGYSGVELQPNVRAMWAVSGRDSIWAAVTRGVRTPSLLENGANVKVATAPGPQGLPAVITVIGDGTSTVESLWATEVGYRRHWSTVSVDASAFRNHYGSLYSLNPGVPELVLQPTPFVRVPYLIGSDLHGRAYGVEATGTWRARLGWTLTAGYTFLDLDLTSDGVEQPDLSFELSEDDTPRHQIVLRSLSSFGRRWEADAALFLRGTSDERRVPAHARLDLRAGYRLSDRLTLSLTGANLLDARHLEFVRVFNEEITQPKRSVVLHTAWTF